MADPAAPAVWLVDKPAGPTSHDVVAGVRRRLGGRAVKVGHAGTLDPFATGLLVLLSGRATRLAPYLVGLDKAYLATVRLGATSDTGDPEGPVREVAPPPPAVAVRGAVAGMAGAQRQRVPAYSAVKVGGERLYRRARRGEAVEAPERDVTVHAIDLLGYDEALGLAELEVVVSTGTYVRQIAADLGERLGCGGYCQALRRTRVGALAVGDAAAPDAVPPAGRLAPARALAHLPARELTPAEAAAVAHGRPVPGEGDGPVALVVGGDLVAVAEPAGEVLRPRVVLT
ncbi:MAG: tRNA pseudouridine(55) synthase TruB [Thermoleophilia bacterium]|nr:tRNA pseudouridine(55) synthase TruB [Thermoleophilia bacterium]